MNEGPRPTGPLIPPQPVTLRNVRRARTWKVIWGLTVIEWQFKTNLFRPKLERTDDILDFFQVGRVRWRTWKWLTFGLSVYRPIEPDPHERIPYE